MTLPWSARKPRAGNSGNFFVPFVVGLAYQGKDIVFRFILEYSSLRGLWPIGNRTICI
jgi:hypothetical protein